jgi:hypothetical protein
LRERIKGLGAQMEELSGVAPDPSALNAAERVRLEAIPADSADSCVPRRTDDPVMRDMAYYLMGDGRAWRTWRQRMWEWAVPGESRGCWRGQPGLSVATGSLDTAGCYLDANGRANLRYATEVTLCRQLDAGKTPQAPGRQVGPLLPALDRQRRCTLSARCRHRRPPSHR